MLIDTPALRASPSSAPDKAEEAQPGSPNNAPRMTNPIMPIYPSTLFRWGKQGYVVVQFRLDQDGKPQNARVVVSEPKGAFDRAVLNSLPRLRYTVPPEWAASHPDRLVEVGYVFVIEKCVSGNLFPGRDMIVVVASRDRPKGNECSETAPAP